MSSRRRIAQKKVPQGPKSQKYTFTFNFKDWKNEKREYDVNAPLALTDVKYLIWQYEFGKNGMEFFYPPSSSPTLPRSECSLFAPWCKETPHLQGFVWLSRQKRITQLRKEMPAHYEVAKGTPAQNYLYCSKCCDDFKLPGHRCKEQRLLGPFELGILPKANGSIALQTMSKMLSDGKTLAQVYLAFPAMYLRYYRALQHVQALIMDNNETRGRPLVFWLHGASGAGKSRAIREAFPNAYLKPRGKWWPNYQFQSTAIFDEYDGWLELKEFLQVVDWHSHKTEYKGGYTNIRVNTFVFASNEDPRDLYKNHKWVKRQAYFRRLIEFGMIYKWNGENFVKDDLRPYFEEQESDPQHHDNLIESTGGRHRYSPY